MRIYYTQLQIKQTLRCAAVNSTHQNVRACVFGGWNTLQRIAHNHLLRTEKASLLLAATHHAHAHIHMVELHNTKDLKVVKLVIERDLNTLEVETAAFILLLFFGAAPSHFDGNGYKKKYKICYRISSN